ncbi:Molybdopterin synthase catalytic subunit 1 [Microbacterium sp. Bi98]|uniref:molybdenum cofactor biosynthesis protein MoaE n=1 Tax=unclassified Microbacterium TaxID=2609290 RepID=UPI0006F27E61|nr:MULTISPECIES: molybdenum cofactor biosynthesis protein MoaE [unclassified Microbacterium]KRD54072.1 molybdenum cofactor biosynthesis protein MoaE [Microbacterium sp. Root280D1]CAH0201233.1 Molybdopterin synthase catalytic subunit 1 [Microbacterium sp. Bi98]
MNEVRIAAISEEKLDVDAHLAAVDDPALGGVTTFIGRVRDNDPDAATPVVGLEYSSHPDAEPTLRRIAEEAAADAVGDARVVVAVSHRIGRLDVGDAAVVIAVAAEHRAEAFEVCRAVIEDIKTSLPVWKRQVESDGSTSWKGIGG